jgi:HlyD family secretion protein
MPHRTRWRLAVAVVVVAAGLGGGTYLALRGPEVSVVTPTQGPVRETVVASGQVLAPAEITLATLVVGTAREVHVREGDVVEAGQLLIELDDRNLEAALDQAKAALAQAQVGHLELTKLSEPAARAQLAQADANLVETKRVLQQAKQLLDSSFGTQADYNTAQTAYAVAKAQREAAQLQLRATQAGGSQAQTTAASIAYAEAQVAVAEAQLQHARIESPVDGVVLARYIEPGDSVIAGTKLLLISRTGQTRLVIEPDERNLARLALGQPALASAEAFPDQRFAAEVQYIAPSVDPQRGTIEVHLAVAEPPAYLRPHMTVSVEVTVGARAEALLIPRQTVRALASDAPFVLVVEGGRLQARPIEIGLRGDAQVEVRSGLDAEAVVIDDPSATLVTGERVRVQPSQGG